MAQPDWAAAAAAWAQSGEGEKNDLAPPPPPPPQSFEQQQPGAAWAGDQQQQQQQQQMWMSQQMDPAAHTGQQHGGFATAPMGVDHMGQGFAHGGV